MSNLLFSKTPLVVNVELAEIIGLNESIVLQQIHYWIDLNTRAKKNNVFKDGKYWTFQTVEEWHKQFPFWSESTLKRILKSLADKGLIIKGNYNKKGFDRTIWYTIQYDSVDALKTEEEKAETVENTHNVKMISAECQCELMHDINVKQPIQEIKEKTNKNLCTTQSSECSFDNGNKNLIENQTHLALSPNMQKQVLSWKVDRLQRAIEIFKKVDGERFVLLKKIYQDDNNFKPNYTKGKTTKFNNFTPRVYDYEDLERKLLGWDKED